MLPWGAPGMPNYFPRPFGRGHLGYFFARFVSFWVNFELTKPTILKLDQVNFTAKIIAMISAVNLTCTVFLIYRSTGQKRGRRQWAKPLKFAAPPKGEQGVLG